MINETDVLAYAIALGVAAGIPGPGITALVARTVGGGSVAGYAMLVGLIMGDLVFLSFAVFGLGLVALTFESVFNFIRWISIAYLLYLAWQFWTAEFQEIDATRTTGKSLFMCFASGFAITLGNPKAIAFYLALLPLVLDLNSITVGVWATVLIPTAVIVLLIVGSVYILGIVSIRHMLASVSAQKRVHRVAAIAMAGAAVSMLAREL